LCGGGPLVGLLARRLAAGWAVRRLTARGALVGTVLGLYAGPPLALERANMAGSDGGVKRYAMHKLAHVLALQPGRRERARPSTTDTAGVRQARPPTAFPQFVLEQTLL
jgi:hypothetical protein